MIFKYLQHIPIQELIAYCDFETYQILLSQCRDFEINNFAQFCTNSDRLKSKNFNRIAKNMVKKAEKTVQYVKI